METRIQFFMCKALKNVTQSMEEKYKAKYERTLNGTGLGQFHTDFELDGCEDIAAIESIFCGKKCYLDILEGVEKKDGDDIISKSGLHIRMKGVNQEAVLHRAEELDPEDETEGVKQIYLNLFAGKREEFDLTVNGRKTCFDVKRDFTVSSRPRFTRKLQFKGDKVKIF